jgi:hypothetical protein
VLYAVEPTLVLLALAPEAQHDERRFRTAVIRAQQRYQEHFGSSQE